MATVVIIGTLDTKGEEFALARRLIVAADCTAIVIDAGIGEPRFLVPDVTAGQVAAAAGTALEALRMGNDRGVAMEAMAKGVVAIVRDLHSAGRLDAIFSLGGSGGSSIVTAAMRALPIGVPKVMVSTMASGDTRPYVGPSDICMMYSVTDVQGIHSISQRVLANAAHALAGMLAHPPAVAADGKPALGLTMFGVTTPCVPAVVKQLGDDYDCLVFHATGVGGQSMEKLADSGLLAGVIDVSTTEIADVMGGGVLSAGATRLDVFARHALPYVGSCGALDMVNFGAWHSVPERFKGRKLYRHNPTVTLMRTTADECRAIGVFLADKLNAMVGPVRFFIPEGGVSAIDKPGQPFHDPDADRVLFTTIEERFRTGADHKLMRLPMHINDDAFAAALVAAWREVAASAQRQPPARAHVPHR